MRKGEISNLYGQEFFAAQWQGALRSARLVASALLELINPQTIVDFGCGWGAWLKAFEELGVTDFKGIDGEYIDRSRLLFDPRHFQQADLRAPIRLERRYDLALCLEVAEHLPKERAIGLVLDLVNAAPVVMFSAAIPGQGGVGHINEQWPSYWADAFARHGYRAVDALRPRLCYDRNVEFFYRQNLVLYVDGVSLTKYPLLAAIAAQEGDGLEQWVYAPLYQSALESPIAMRKLIRELPGASARVLRRFIRTALGSVAYRTGNASGRRGSEANVEGLAEIANEICRQDAKR